MIGSEHTVAMAVMLDRDTQHFEAVHPDSRGLDPLFIFQDHVDRPGQQPNKCISLTRRQKDSGQFQL